MRKFFPKNIGSMGRAFRLFIALTLFVYAYFYESYIALFFALFTLFEVLMGWCAFLHLIGKSSCPIDKDPKK